MNRYVDLDERVTAQFYDQECEEWTMQTATIEDVLDSVCDEYTVLPSADPEAAIVKVLKMVEEYKEKTGTDEIIIMPKNGMKAWDENGVEYTMQPTCNNLATDCVYRQEAIDAMCKLMNSWFGGDSSKDEREEITWIINHLPSAQQWIPCSERVPEKSGQYYVSGGDKVWICEYLIIPNFTGGWCNDVANPVVQAWMPLPEPYKERREK